MKSGFVNIFGKPNAGKSTFLNAMIGEKLAIVSSKVQTTRHRIKGILTGEGYQVIISDTPGIIEPKYKLHEKMMQAVKSALEDADLALLIVDVSENPAESHQIFDALKLKVPAIVLLNKIDKAKAPQINSVKEFFVAQKYCKEVIEVSALNGVNHDELINLIKKYLPEGEAFYEGDEMTDLPTKFFVGEIVREKIFNLFKDEIPYHTTVAVKEFKEKSTLIKISADIIVQRETQKGILLGEGGKMIRQLGTDARKDIEQFLGQKVFLELFVRVKPKWRDSDFMLKEYGYH
ncbi:MAG: GTPase Era [Flavitalea sp.]